MRLKNNINMAVRSILENELEQGKYVFAEKLKMLREERKLSQYELANKMGCSRGLISNYEQGVRRPDHDRLRDFSKFFDVSIDFLLGNENNYVSEQQAIIKIKDALIKTGVCKPTGELCDHQIDELVHLIRSNADKLKQSIEQKK